MGHDTNLASVGSLLGLTWGFNDARLPEETRGLPDNDALPAGALVFELRLRGGTYSVRVEYVTQSLKQMQDKSNRDKAFRLAVRGQACQGGRIPCEMSVGDFNQLVNQAIGTDRAFLSRCHDGRQVCTKAKGH